MAFLDLDDRIDQFTGDFIITSSRQFKSYNLLAHRFPDRPEIGINISAYIMSGIDAIQLDDIIFEYLNHFNASPDLLDIQYDYDSGRLVINLMHKLEGN